MQKIKQIIKKLILWYSYMFYKKNYGSKIIYYHDIFDKTQYTDMGTSLEMFKKHIQMVTDCGFKIVDAIQNPTNEVMICLDDGFRGIYDTKDFFAQNNIKPLVFIAVELIGQENYLSKEEILELQSIGFRFEGHSWSHNNLTKFNDEGLKRELLDSKIELSKLLGKEVTELCFPQGYFSDKVIEKSIEYGYKKLYTSLPGNFYDNIGEKLCTRNLVQYASPKELKYRLLGNSEILIKRALNLHKKQQQMPTLFQINSVINSGSTGRIAEEIGLKAMRNGWESYIAYGRSERPSKSKKIKIGNKFGIYWHVLITRLFDKHGLGSKRATKQLVKEIEKIQPDIIHLHNIHGYYLNYEILFKYLKTADIPVVWTLHDCWTMTGHCAHFENANCNKWQKQCCECVNKKKYPASFLMDRAKKNFTQKKELFTAVENMTIVPVSYWLENIVKQSFLKNYNARVIQNGIDLDVFSPKKEKTFLQKKKIDVSKNILLGVASCWSDEKGLGDFVKLSRLQDKDDKIILVGLNKKQMQNLPKKIIGIKRTDNVEELAELYSIATVFVNPTYGDTFPTTNLEALACGTPVITYKTGGSVESVDEKTGFVIEKGDLNALINAVSQIKQKEKDFYSKKCRERAVHFYNKDDRYKEYINLYSELMN